jgi:hypothetical protein
LKARETAIRWVDEKPDTFFEDSEFVAALLFCPHAEIRKWVSEKMVQEIIHQLKLN